MVKKIYLFRHGETDWNKENRYQHSIDVELNETGLKQAELNANMLKNKGIQHIYSSPLKRAHKTAEILANLINVNVEIVEGLREMSGGLAEGMIKDEVIKLVGLENYEKFSHSRDEAMDFGFPGGETKRQIRNRIYNTVLNICKTTPYDVIGIATHGFVLRELIRAVNFENDYGLKNCEIVEAECDNEVFKITKRVRCEN